MPYNIGTVVFAVFQLNRHLGAVCNLGELDQLQNIGDDQLLDYHHSSSQLSVHNQRMELMWEFQEVEPKVLPGAWI